MLRTLMTVFFICAIFLPHATVANTADQRLVLNVASESHFSQFIAMAREGRFDQANALLEKWEGDQPKDAGNIKLLRQANRELAKEPSKDRREAMIDLLVKSNDLMKMTDNLNQEMAPLGEQVSQLKSPFDPLFEAILANDQETVKSLLANKSDPNQVFVGMSTPLSVAAQRADKEIVALLLEHGASINTKDLLGLTPLMIAIKAEKLDVARLLLDKGADKAIKSDRDGLTAWDLAQKARDPQIREILKDN
jgi:ankyrin repeat protein